MDDTVLLIYMIFRFLVCLLCLGVSGYLYFAGKPGAGWFLFIGLLFGWFGVKSSV